MSSLTPTQYAKKHHDLLPLEVWSVYSDPAKQAEYNLARFDLSRHTPEALAAQAADATKGWTAAFLASLLLWALAASVVVQAVGTIR
jgi:hypothetical protein